MGEWIYDPDRGIVHSVTGATIGFEHLSELVAAGIIDPQTMVVNQEALAQAYPQLAAGVLPSSSPTAGHLEGGPPMVGVPHFSEETTVSADRQGVDLQELNRQQFGESIRQETQQGGGVTPPPEDDDGGKKGGGVPWWQKLFGPVGKALGGWPGVANAGLNIWGAHQQQQAYDKAAEIQAQSAREQLDFAKQIYGDQRADQAPWLAAGQRAVGQIEDPSLLAGWDREFVAPDASAIYGNPAVLARLKSAQDAMERSAAARGTLMTSGLLEDVGRRQQEIAGDEYDRIYGRARDEFNTAYNIFGANQQNRFNRLASIAGLGQTSANQLGVSARDFANTGTSAMSADANARATARVGTGNAWANAAGNIFNTGQDHRSGTSLDNLERNRQLFGPPRR